MIVFFAVILIGVLMCLFFAGLIGVVSTFEEYGPKLGSAAALAFIVAIAAIAAVGVAYSGDDPHANQLCLSGYERWHTVNTGKSSYEEKVWVCTQWEAK